MLDAGFEAILATVLLMGVAYAIIDDTDFPAPAGDIVIALFALALYVLAVVLATAVKNEALSDRFMASLAAANAGFALLLVVWVLVADGFTSTGLATIWSTVVILLALAAAQALAVGRR